METTTINETQQHLMKMFAFNRTKKSLDELKKVLFEYYSNRLDAQLDDFWKSKKMTKKKLSADSRKHLRTAYK